MKIRYIRWFALWLCLSLLLAASSWAAESDDTDHPYTATVSVDDADGDARHKAFGQALVQVLEGFDVSLDDQDTIEHADEFVGDYHYRELDDDSGQLTLRVSFVQSSIDHLVKELTHGGSDAGVSAAATGGLGHDMPQIRLEGLHSAQAFADALDALSQLDMIETIGIEAVQDSSALLNLQLRGSLPQVLERLQQHSQFSVHSAGDTPTLEWQGT